MTFEDLKAVVFRRLNESASSPVFWTEDDVEDALNAGYMELSDQTEWHEETRTLDLLNDRPYYDARTVFGETFLAVGRLFDETTNRWLIPSSVRELDGAYARWEQVTGEAVRVITRGLWWIGLWPRTQTESGTVRVDIVTLPEPFADEDEEPGFPDAFHDGPIEWALADLWAQDGEATRALAAWDRYLAIETALQAWVNDRTISPRVHRA